MSETSEEREKRIVDLLAKSMYRTALRIFPEDVTALTEKGLAEIRAAGGDVTVPDLPERTYTVRLTNDEWHLLRYLTNNIRNGMAFSKSDREHAETLHMRICRIDPDPVTS